MSFDGLDHPPNPAGGGTGTPATPPGGARPLPVYAAREAFLTEALSELRILFYYVVSAGKDIESSVDISAEFSRIHQFDPATMTGPEEEMMWKLTRTLTTLAAPATAEGIRLQTILHGTRKNKVTWKTSQAWVWALSTLVVVMTVQFYTLMLGSSLDIIHDNVKVLYDIDEQYAKLSQAGVPTDDIDGRRMQTLRVLEANYDIITLLTLEPPRAGPPAPPPSDAGADQILPMTQGMTPVANTGRAGDEHIRNTQQATILYRMTSLHFLPMFYGLLGATVFVLRTIHKEIEDLRISEVRASRHVLRYVLGLVLGFSVGLLFTTSDGPSLADEGISNTTTLPLAALAFFAGFSVEAVFSQLDRLIDAWSRRDKPPSAPTAQRG